MALKLFYPQPIKDFVQNELENKPGLKESFERLEDSIEANPKQSSPEVFILNNGSKICCYKKSTRATSYSKNMTFSKDEIVILYEVLVDMIRVVCVFFPS